MQPCQLDDLSGWVEADVASIPEQAHRCVILEVNANLDSFVKWPERAELLWSSCDRIPNPDRKRKYHRYPEMLKALFRERGIKLDGRGNGPAVAAYLVAGGERPKRNGNKGWSVHHIYDRNFPYPGATESMWAVRDPRHFTQSAGLVAIHPVADALADEFAIFAWRLRAESFLRFGYDPDGVFKGAPDEYGFAGRRCQRVRCDDPV